VKSPDLARLVHTGTEDENTGRQLRTAYVKSVTCIKAFWLVILPTRADTAGEHGSENEDCAT